MARLAATSLILDADADADPDDFETRVGLAGILYGRRGSSCELNHGGVVRVRRGRTTRETQRPETSASHASAAPNAAASIAAAFGDLGLPDLRFH